MIGNVTFYRNWNSWNEATLWNCHKSDRKASKKILFTTSALFSGGQSQSALLKLSAQPICHNIEPRKPMSAPHTAGFDARFNLGRHTGGMCFDYLLWNFHNLLCIRSPTESVTTAALKKTWLNSGANKLPGHSQAPLPQAILTAIMVNPTSDLHNSRHLRLDVKGTKAVESHPFWDLNFNMCKALSILYGLYMFDGLRLIHTLVLWFCTFHFTMYWRYQRESARPLHCSWHLKGTHRSNSFLQISCGFGEWVDIRWILGGYSMGPRMHWSVANWAEVREVWLRSPVRQLEKVSTLKYQGQQNGCHGNSASECPIDTWRHSGDLKQCLRDSCCKATQKAYASDSTRVRCCCFVWKGPFLRDFGELGSCIHHIRNKLVHLSFICNETNNQRFSGAHQCCSWEPSLGNEGVQERVQRRTNRWLLHWIPVQFQRWDRHQCRQRHGWNRKSTKCRWGDWQRRCTCFQEKLSIQHHIDQLANLLKASQLDQPIGMNFPPKVHRMDPGLPKQH